MRDAHIGGLRKGGTIRRWIAEWQTSSLSIMAFPRPGLASASVCALRSPSAPATPQTASLPVPLVTAALAIALEVVLADGRVGCWRWSDSDSPGMLGQRGASPLLLPFPKVAQHFPSDRHYLIEGLTLPSWVISDEQQTA